MIKPILFLFSLFVFLTSAFVSGVNGNLDVAFIALVMAFVSFGLMWLAIWKVE